MEHFKFQKVLENFQLSAQYCHCHQKRSRPKVLLQAQIRSITRIDRCCPSQWFFRCQLKNGSRYRERWSVWLSVSYSELEQNFLMKSAHICKPPLIRHTDGLHYRWYECQAEQQQHLDDEVVRRWLSLTSLTAMSSILLAWRWMNCTSPH